jgi:hypothetical protein
VRRDTILNSTPCHRRRRQGCRRTARRHPQWRGRRRP